MGDHKGKQNTNFVEHNNSDTFSATNITSIISQLTPDSTNDDAAGKYAIGVVILFVGVWISSTAGVYSEWVLKRKPTNFFYMQGLYLYVWGVIFNTAALFITEPSRVLHEGLFANYNWYCLAIILTASVFGLSVAVILKFLDNIAGVYVHSLAMVFTMLASAIWFDFKPSVAFVIGLILIILSLYLYHKEPDPSDPANFMRKERGPYQKVGKEKKEAENYDTQNGVFELLDEGDLNSDTASENGEQGDAVLDVASTAITQAKTARSNNLKTIEMCSKGVTERKTEHKSIDDQLRELDELDEGVGLL